MNKPASYWFLAMNRKKISFVLLVVSAVIVRFLWLDKFPPGVTHDEMDIVLSTKTLWGSGADISGVRFPDLFFKTFTQSKQAGLPAVLLAPLLGPFKLDAALIRLPMILVNLLSVFLIYKLVRKLTDDRDLANISAIVALVNPWLFFYSRLVIDAPFSLMLTLWGMYLIFSLKSKNIIFSIIPFVLAFLSYFGAKPIIPFLYIILIFIRAYYSDKDDTNDFIRAGSVFLAIIISLVYISFATSGGSIALRFREINQGGDNIATEVNYLRRISLENNFKEVFINKATVISNESFYKYINFLSPSFLFFTGDPSGAWRFGGHGMFYMVDLIFILTGIYFLRQSKYQKISKVILTLFVTAPLGTAILAGGESYIFRAYLLIPAFIILISVGIKTIFFKFDHKMLKYFIRFLIVGIYSFSIINFFYFYFSIYPISQSSNHYLGERILASYLSRSDNKSLEVTVVSSSPVQQYLQFLFYSGGVVDVVNFENNEYRLHGLIFTDLCPEKLKESSETILQADYCKIKNKNFKIIQNPKDSGGIFYIGNDQVCRNYELTTYKSSNNIKEFSPENLNDMEFCQIWINRFE